MRPAPVFFMLYRGDLRLLLSVPGGGHAEVLESPSPVHARAGLDHGGKVAQELSEPGISEP
jgi:hypothetical protein